jgi:2-polyprenyl-3-methyl-5-hydroxy-6-metoxy-1,4-benzoquinol methylase
VRYTNYIEHYEKDAEVYDYLPALTTQLGQSERRRAELLMKMADAAALRRDAVVLDIGAGGGQLVRLIARRGRRVIGIDIPLRNLKRIRGSLSAPLQKFFIPLSADAYALPLREASADLVFLSEIIEHLEEPAAVLREVRRVLKPDGAVVLSSPYREKIVEHLCIHCNRPTPSHAHLHSVDEQFLERTLSGAGLQIVETKYFHNKALNAAGYPLLARGWNYATWRFFDVVAHAIYRKPLFIAVKARL